LKEKLVCIGEVCWQNCWQKWHAAATLGGTTKDRNDPICVTSPKVAKASTLVTVACCCPWRYHLKNIANVNTDKVKI